MCCPFSYTLGLVYRYLASGASEVGELTCSKIKNTLYVDITHANLKCIEVGSPIAHDRDL